MATRYRPRARAKREQAQFRSAVIVAALCVAAIVGTLAQPLFPGLRKQGIAFYPNCAFARWVGVAPLSLGDAGYRSGLDRDGDGRACEPKPY